MLVTLRSRGSCTCLAADGGLTWSKSLASSGSQSIVVVRVGPSRKYRGLGWGSALRSGGSSSSWSCRATGSRSKWRASGERSECLAHPLSTRSACGSETCHCGLGSWSALRSGGSSSSTCLATPFPRTTLRSGGSSLPCRVSGFLVWASAGALRPSTRSAWASR